MRKYFKNDVIYIYIYKIKCAFCIISVSNKSYIYYFPSILLIKDSDIRNMKFISYQPQYTYLYI